MSTERLLGNMGKLPLVQRFNWPGIIELSQLPGYTTVADAAEDLLSSPRPR